MKHFHRLIVIKGRGQLKMANKPQPPPDPEGDAAKSKANISKHPARTHHTREHATKEQTITESPRAKFPDKTEGADDSLGRRTALKAAGLIPARFAEELLRTQKELLECQKENNKNQEEMSSYQRKINEEQLKINHSLHRLTKLGVRVAIFGIFVTVILTVASIFTTYLLSRVRANQKQTHDEIRQIQRQVQANQPVMSLQNNEAVGPTATISVMTPFSGWNHYIEVTDEEGRKWVYPVQINPDGSFTGDAIFGQGDEDIGKTFIVKILATKYFYVAGRLSSEPTDARFSEEVKVVRQR